MRPKPDPIIRPTPGLSCSLVLSLREPRTRAQTGLYLAEGLRFLIHAIERQTPIAGVILGPGRPVPGDLIGRLAALGCPILRVSATEFEALATSEDAGHSVISVLHQTWTGLPKAILKHDLWVGIENVKNPGNLGTLIRSAAAVGARGLMVFGPIRDRADPFDPGCVRAAMGALSGMAIVETTHAEFRRWRLRYELTVIAATGSAARDYRAVTYRRPVLIMLGHERSGLSEAQRETADIEVRIPMAAAIDSLNLAMASTVLLYEAYSQRHPIRKK